MPYRAMITTVITVAFALAAVGLWIRLIEPHLAASNAAATQAATQTTQPRGGEDPARVFSGTVQTTMLCAFLLICVLLAVGFFATLREWIHYGRSRTRSRKTPYVDAWKLAGQRMRVGPSDGPPPPAGSGQ